MELGDGREEANIIIDFSHKSNMSSKGTWNESCRQLHSVTSSIDTYCLLLSLASNVPYLNTQNSLKSQDEFKQGQNAIQ